MRRTLHLRPWQKDALDRLHRHPDRDFLTVATPGAGKTTFALTAVLQDLARHPHRAVVVVAPTQHLKHQWADNAAAFGLHLEPEWASRDAALPHDMHGIVVTYQQVASAPDALRRSTDDAFVVFDEIHHAGTDRAWGDAVFHAFEYAGRRLSLSGTPFRSDQNAIPFVAYDFEEARPDYSYGYGDALKDGGVVRPVFFPRINGHMEWTSPEGAHLSATFDDVLDRAGASQRLRTALSVDGEWLPTVLDQAHEQLTSLRETQPDAGGLVIAMDVDHALAIGRLMRARLGVDPVVATSDDPDASAKIGAFTADDAPWIVAVRMVSEGVDIPRLRVGVWATNVVTELFFRQAVGRLVRWRKGMRRQKAFMFIPDDARLRFFAASIGEERTHSLKRREEDGEQAPEDLDELAQAERDEQLSLFQAISATPLADQGPASVFDDAYGEDLVHDEVAELHLQIELTPPPPRGGATTSPGTVTVSRAQRKKELRRANTDRVQMLAHLTGFDHQRVNAELNERAKVASVAKATVEQLERRLHEADRWIDRV